MEHGYTVEQVRAAEARALRQSPAPDTLMRRAASGLAAVVLRTLRGGPTGAYGARVLLVVGSGNNGGDALFAGARLAARGVAVTAWRAGSGVHEAGWAALLAAGGREVEAGAAFASLPRQRLVVDAVAGIGSRPGLAAPVARMAAACRDLGVGVVAVDLPSGLAPEPPFEDAAHFTAALTVSFGGHKLCQLLEPAASACGRVELVDIGLALPGPTVTRWEEADLAAAWPVPDATSDKYSRGVVGVDAGSAAYPGAGVLAVAGAVGAGAGMVRCLGPEAVAARVLERFPNVVTAPGRVQALVLGPGWGERRDAAATVAAAVGSGLPVVLDADAIGHLPGRGHPGVLLTPHAGELARLLGRDRGEVAADPLAAVGRAVELTGCTVLLKGATQYVAGPSQDRVWLAVPGPSWTAQAGSGDVLAGACGTLLAAGLPPVRAALAAAGLQALTAARHPGPLPPHALAERFNDSIEGFGQTCGATLD